MSRKEYLQLGDHLLAGITFTYYEQLKLYMFMITFCFMHFTIDFSKTGIRFSFSIGDAQMSLKVSIGYMGA
jgi:hypothetical protein